MLRISKTIIGMLLAVAGAQEAGAFSLWGPAEAWQATALDYQNRSFWYGEVENGATKNFGEGSRLQVPVITYAYDSTFLSYFGQDGVKAVDSAFAVFNKLPNVSSMSKNLTEYITQGNQQINYTAQALGMLDIKSAVMGLIIEHMGLIGETHVYDLRQRMPPPGAPACNFDYAVILRNFDPVTYDPTPWVNGTLYSFYVGDNCAIGGTPQSGDAFELPVDATIPAFDFSAVATKEGLNYGGFYLGLTRDDVGGLRYLYRKNNYVDQTVDPQSFTFPSGGGSPFSTPPGLGLTNALATNTITEGVFGGVEKVLFVKVAYDSQVGSTFIPRQYTYTIPYVFNSRLQNLTATRIIAAPDMIITAADLFATIVPFVDPIETRSAAFQASPAPSPGGGILPSVISPQEVITLNKVGTTYINFSPSFLDLGTGIQFLIWGSFDGTTNAPIVYPTGSSLAQLEQQVLSGGSAAPSGAFNPVVVATNGVTNVVVPLTY